MIVKAAKISECKAYRYALSRIWDNRKPALLFIMLNPSKADHRKDDNTIRRLYTFSDNNGCGGFHVVNLFAFRSTNPKDLVSIPDPIGSENNEWIQSSLENANKVVCAWGVNGFLFDRDTQVLELLSGVDLYCLGTTKKGLPRHPLMVASKTPLIPFNRGTHAAG